MNDRLAPADVSMTNGTKFFLRLIVEIFHALSRELFVAGKIKVRAAVNSFYLAHPNGKPEFNVECRLCIVCKLLVLCHCSWSRFIPRSTEPLEPLFSPRTRTICPLRRVSQILHLHLSNSRVRKRKFLVLISLRNAFPIWAMPNGSFCRRRALNIEEIDEIP